ncbi:DnaB-like helicase C-terminal domain-containing protein [Orientia tsutsugamushi]|uniref:DnaB-like helicase C-terminal domain-containing protein n=1 Tax=Orientia tsutsugamushi TaxID=784 RepID=UPI00315CC26A
MDELQESYQLYEDKLNVGQRRVRQCLVELRDAGFIEIENRTIIKDNVKLRNVPCIKILKNFQHYSEKGKEENIALPEKKFRPNMKEISGQPETFFRDIYRYIKKSKISRSTEGELVENKKNENEEQNFQNVDDFENDIQISTQNCNQGIESLITKILKSSNCKKEWFKRYRLEEFYPLTPEDSDLIILAGRPSMGKTALGVNLAINACKYFLTQKNTKDNVVPSVGFFSLEISSQQISTRILSIESEINSSALFNGKIGEQDIDKLKTVQDEIQKWNFFIDDAPEISISAIRSRARRLKRTHNLAILFVDYLQLIKIDNRRSQYNRVQEISEITQSLKALAKDLNISIIALSQLSRAVEQRSDKKPILSDLRESCSIEQDADIVMLIYRDEYYLSRSEPDPGTPEYTEWKARQNKCYNTAEIIVAKHRNEPVGTVNLHYDNRYSKFGNIVKNSQQG